LQEKIRELVEQRLEINGVGGLWAELLVGMKSHLIPLAPFASLRRIARGATTACH
jgi:hypothetical protein